MTVYDYPEYEADKSAREAGVARLERVAKALAELQERWDAINVRASGNNDDVVVEVNSDAQLTSLTLAPGCTMRYTNTGLTDLINATITDAVGAAAEEFHAVAGGEDLAEAVEELADPDSEIWRGE